MGLLQALPGARSAAPASPLPCVYRGWQEEQRLWPWGQSRTHGNAPSSQAFLYMSQKGTRPVIEEAKGIIASGLGGASQTLGGISQQWKH